jgi:hypothetical protein
VRNVLGCGSFLIVSGRVLLSDVSSPPREVRTPAADDDRRDGRDSPRRTGSARAVAPRTKTTVGRRCAAAGGPPGDNAPRAGHRPPPPSATATRRSLQPPPRSPAERLCSSGPHARMMEAPPVTMTFFGHALAHTTRARSGSTWHGWKRAVYHTKMPYT